MLEIKLNLDKRICDCEPWATNTQTYREFFIEGYASIGMPFDNPTELDKFSNSELNELLYELDWLITK